MVYLKATKLEQIMLQQRAKMQWMKGGDQCTRVFFRRVAMRRASKRIFQISDDDGHTYTEPKDMMSKLPYLILKRIGLPVRMGSLLDFSKQHDRLWEKKSRLQLRISLLRILDLWIREVLDKIISPSQNAFVPGRSISDNVMLAQELFSGYNQCRLPPRCALKVDLRKAYDTVEWDFLVATLHLFGFPIGFIRWIEECVTTPHFSLYLNGEQFIEQDGDFAYHWKCKDLSLFQLNFAYDLLLLCKAEKRQLIISKAAHGIRASLLETLGFQEGHLPVQYLDLPLISSRLTISDYQPLFQKIDSRIHGWEGTNLSFAGMVQLIKSVLLALGVFWAMAFLLPKGVIKEIDKRLRTFLWKGTTASGYPKVTWDFVCRLLEEGGQGIRDVQALNRALMSRHLWAVISHDRTSIWVDWITHYRLRGKSVWTVSTTKGVWGWRKMLALRNILLPHIQFRVGSGGSFSLWHDSWHHLGPLILAFPRGPQLTQTAPHDLLNMVIENGSWR
ncbi:hypothetical protein Sango_3071600 [Sesamum angolense]|uniref:Reverse transcriptase domain-containing protein n=1 Tax=Sesamum angolense TaxID=2727404 RepID=A0AAE1T9E4_9LAMI|nr:hypothetical protein Sango_3071600 [Sesamum angolense]